MDNSDKYPVMCNAPGLGSFKCFSRNMKPRIKLTHYPKSGRCYWHVERDMSIQWRHLTMQEQSNIHAADDYAHKLNREMEMMHDETGVLSSGLWYKG